MKKVAWITDDIYLKHNTGEGHPESARRLKSINLKIASIQDNLIEVSPRFATQKQIELIHHKSQIDEVRVSSQMEKSIDADTICSKDSYQVALKAVGAGLEAVDGIKRGEFERAFCAVRPPGHHATPTKSMGFCLFNNIAITARYAQEMGYKRVMIIDFDVHHGNGTQDAFYSDDTVFYFSTHQAFAYPGTGEESQKGRGKGVGYTANHPMMPNSGDKEILEIYNEELPKSYEFFKPDIILVSAGYDLHESDPLAMLDITTNGIIKIVRSILNLGDKPIIFMLEGGYNIYDLGMNVLVTLKEMLR